MASRRMAEALLSSKVAVARRGGCHSYLPTLSSQLTPSKTTPASQVNKTYPRPLLSRRQISWRLPTTTSLERALWFRPFTRRSVLARSTSRQPNLTFTRSTRIVRMTCITSRSLALKSTEPSASQQRYLKKRGLTPTGRPSSMCMSTCRCNRNQRSKTLAFRARARTPSSCSSRSRQRNKT